MVRASRCGCGRQLRPRRDFRQNFAFRDCRGHHWPCLPLLGHWHPRPPSHPQNFRRYLAGDVGATIDIKRVFPNGVALGAWATKTNVSAQQFGEGSFHHKGIYLNMPFDVFLPRSTGGTASLVWNPLTRDGGAKLYRRFPLSEITRLRSPDIWRNKPATPTQLATAANTTGIELAEPVHPLSDCSRPPAPSATRSLVFHPKPGS